MKPFTLIIFIALLTTYGSYIISPPFHHLPFESPPLLASALASPSLSLPPPYPVAYESCKRSYTLARASCLGVPHHTNENPINQIHCWLYLTPRNLSPGPTFPLGQLGHCLRPLSGRGTLKFWKRRGSRNWNWKLWVLIGYDYLVWHIIYCQLC